MWSKQMEGVTPYSGMRVWGSSASDPLTLGVPNGIFREKMLNRQLEYLNMELSKKRVDSAEDVNLK